MTCKLTGHIVGTTALFIAAGAIGQTEIPNTFQAGQPARAAEVNENFSTLESAVNKNASDLQQIQIGPQGPQGIQGVQGDIGPQGSRSADFNQPYEFAGFSDTDAAGNGGLVALNQACNAKFGPGARIASSWEILETSFNSEDAIAAGIAGR